MPNCISFSVCTYSYLLSDAGFTFVPGKPGLLIKNENSYFETFIEIVTQSCKTWSLAKVSSDCHFKDYFYSVIENDHNFYKIDRKN